ncbi:hypothetical protein PG991_001182 [Apiospora marii]|uniref:2EXR domain-containing protein n=1 Tax=Apiospora marii TaxID=335849 RepID=A0ABR1SVF2_9PEZI
MGSHTSSHDTLDDTAQDVVQRADAAETSFALMRLPPELRNEIWAFALPTDRVLLACIEYDALRPLPIPVLAWVCRESRDIALRHGRYYSLGRIRDPSQRRWTWFSPDLDRVMLSFANRQNAKFLCGWSGTLALDVRHVLVQDTYTYDHQWNQLSEVLLRAWSRQLGLQPADIALYPNVRSIGVIKSGVFIEKGSDWHRWDETKNFSATGITRRVRPHEPTGTRPGQPAVCSCCEGPEKPPENRHWLPDLARPYSSKSLWRMLRLWFEMQNSLRTPHTAPSDAPMDIAWVTQTKRRAPHVYPAEMTGYGDRHLRATPGPRCMQMRGVTYNWVKGEDLLERLVGDPGDVDVDQQQVAEPSGPWPLPAVSP